jgi:hypothetical protein
VSEQGLPLSDGVALAPDFRPLPEEVKQPDRPKLRDILGPGLITGASDDDPSGIATYSQAGAQFGYGLGWTLLLTYPLMCAIQMISAQIGRVTGRGLAGNMRRHYPAPLLYFLVGLLIVANTINIGADLGAMAAALRLLVAGPTVLYVAAFAVVCGFRRSRPCIPIGSRPPIPIRSRPPFRFEAGHPAFASADRGDDVSTRRLGQADVDFGLAEAEKDGRVAKGGWVGVGNAGGARPPQRRSVARIIHSLAAPRVGPADLRAGVDFRTREVACAGSRQPVRCDRRCE